LRLVNVNAFHEKTGRSQVGWFLRCTKSLSTELPLSPPFHPRHRNDRPLLAVPPASLSQFQSPAPQIAVHPERSWMCYTSASAACADSLADG